MKHPESSIASAGPFRWKSYSVQRAGKEPLLRFLIEALEMRGCKVMHASATDRAPFYFVFETPAGDRRGVLAYAFFANSKLTKNRPEGEHRFQIKYGGQLRGVLDVAIDPTALVTTIFLGIDPDRGIFVAADPIMNNPSPMSRSIEFKAQNVADILRAGWVAWERERHAPKTKTRPTPDVDERIQILIGGRKEHLFDLIELEQMARRLEPGERHLIADKLLTAERPSITKRSHKLLDEFEIPPEALFNLIEGASRLKMAVRGWVAESHLETALKSIKGVSDCRRLEEDGKPDIQLRWKGSPPIFIECKNVLRKTTAAGHPKVDFQRTRASKNDPCSRYYRASDFQILAACLHPITEKWIFSYALTTALPAHLQCDGRIASNVVVNDRLFGASPETVFNAVIDAAS